MGACLVTAPSREGGLGAERSVNSKKQRGPKQFTYRYHWLTQMPLRDGKDAQKVNWNRCIGYWPNTRAVIGWLVDR